MVKERFKSYMPIDEALAFVHSQMQKHPRKIYGSKDRALITLAHYIVELDKAMYGETRPPPSSGNPEKGTV